MCHISTSERSEKRLITCVYNAQVCSGKSSDGIDACGSAAMLVISDVEARPNSISPSQIQKGFASAKAAALSASKSLKCATCDKDASKICSSIITSRGHNNELNFSEKIICSCDDDECISKARLRRNDVARGAWLAFRCAMEPISNAFALASSAALPRTTAVGRHPLPVRLPSSATGKYEKENAHNNVEIDGYDGHRATSAGQNLCSGTTIPYTIPKKKLGAKAARFLVDNANANLKFNPYTGEELEEGEVIETLEERFGA